MVGQSVTVERRHPGSDGSIKLHHSVAAVAGFGQNGGGLSIACECMLTHMGKTWGPQSGGAPILLQTSSRGWRPNPRRAGVIFWFREAGLSRPNRNLSRRPAVQTDRPSARRDHVARCLSSHLSIHRMHTSRRWRRYTRAPRTLDHAHMRVAHVVREITARMLSNPFRRRA